jgi:hypothetical protein
VKADTLKGEK